MSRFEHRRKWLFLLICIGVVISLWERYQIRRESRQAALVKAVVWRESRFNPMARGTKGEVGLMQLMPETAGEWAQAEKFDLRGGQAMFDPEINTRAGAWYLRKLSRRYLNTDNPLIYTLADYNAGRSKVLKWAKDAGTTNSEVFVEQIGFPSTKHYVISVSQRFQYYSKRFPPAGI